MGSEDGWVYVIIDAKGEWTVDLQYPPEGPRDWATMDPPAGTDVPPVARLRFSENEEETPRTVTLVLNNKGKQASATFEQRGKSAVVPDPDPTGHYGEDVTSAGWLELPQTVANDGCDFFTVDYEGRKYVNNTKSGTRNYSFYWNYLEHVSFWVAYPLNVSLRGGGNYGYDWANSLSSDLTAMIPVNLLPNITGASYGGNDFSGNSNSYWARGHQLPRKDRQVSQIAVRSTCYPVNITPQDQAFNGGIWGNLENAVRGYADSSDTTYVVTGCVVAGSKAKTSNRSGFAINVPAAYFKAVLQKSTSASVGYNGWRAAAWYLPHEYSIAKGNFRDYVMTVDALETKLGNDLFVNLPAKVGKDLADKIEADCNWAK